MSRASITIDRDGMPGDPDPIVISEDGDRYRLTENGVGYVVDSVRTTTAPASPFFDGEEIVAFAREASSLPLEFHILPDSDAMSTPAEAAASVREARDELNAALYRLAYTVTREVEGVADTYSGGPCLVKPSRNVTDSGVSAAGFDTFTVTIPFPNPNTVPDGGS